MGKADNKICCFPIISIQWKESGELLYTVLVARYGPQSVAQQGMLASRLKGRIKLITRTYRARE